MEIKVLFFGILAEVAKTGFRQYSGINSFADLRLRIKDDYPEFAHYKYRVSVNNEIIIDDPALKNGDEIAFMPPFAGG
jgi:molybdopterin synthase sulfur carrier subunit